VFCEIGPHDSGFFADFVSDEATLYFITDSDSAHKSKKYNVLLTCPDDPGMGLSRLADLCDRDTPTLMYLNLISPQCNIADSKILKRLTFYFDVPLFLLLPKRQQFYGESPMMELQSIHLVVNWEMADLDVLGSDPRISRRP